MPKLLLIGLGLGDTKRYIVTDLLAGGYELILLAEQIPDWAGPYLARVQRAGLRDFAAAADTATALGRQHAVDAVFTCDEAYVELAALVAGRLGLPGLTAEAARLCRDKLAMRRRLAEAGIGSAASIVAASRAQARLAAEQIGYPVVLKPRNLGGSIGVVRADCPADLDALFDVPAEAVMSRVSPLSGLLVEEYLDGPEYSVESVITDGTTITCGITEKVLGFAPFFEETGHFARPVDPGAEPDAQLIAIVAAVHKALEIGVGATHCEIRMTRSGPRVIEIAGRVGGDRIPAITRLATGVDLIGAAAAAAVGAPVTVRPSCQRVAGIRMIYPDADGVLVRRQARPDRAGLLADLGWYVQPGQRVALPPRGFLSRLGYLVAVGATRQEVGRRLDAGQELLDIGIEPGTALAPAGAA
ncbi:MAG TPA: ATP-grasp domain-containing protein [Streptosporangiaceae bacterium]